VVRHKKKKPGCIDEVIEHFQGRVSAGEMAMVGDRYEAGMEMSYHLG
jgi:hypothetical protein